MTLLPESEILDMRSVAEETLDDSAVIQTRTYKSDGGGGGTTVWTASGTVDCHISPITVPENAEPLVGGRVTPQADWNITIPAVTSISTESRIVSGGRTFEVTALRSPRTYELTRRVEANEVQ